MQVSDPSSVYYVVKTHQIPRIRKVKCDEGKPACRRCVSTGRSCDGYGVWGGGQKPYSRSQAAQIQRPGAVICRPVNAYFPSRIPAEKECFDWFVIRTVRKLPGSYSSEFWSMILLQASHSEPAVLHASLALSAIHKTGIVNNDATSNMEQFALQNYVKAIGLLKPHFEAKQESSSRVILIVCIIFVSLELLRGHFGTARTHLENGLRIIKDSHESSPSSACGQSQFNALSGNFTSDCILESMSRLYIQSELFSPFDNDTGETFQQAEKSLTLRKFSSCKEAWRFLNGFMCTTMQLKSSSRGCDASNSHPSSLINKRAVLLKNLKRWLSAFNASEKALLGSGSIEEQKFLHLLGIYHTMTTIMADTCLSDGDEMVFDSHTHLFKLLVRQIEGLYETSRLDLSFEIHKTLPFRMATSIMDLGCIAPLYYVAIKCRVHRVRCRAIDLLEPVRHREGMWDPRIATLVARKALDLEGTSHVPGMNLGDDDPYDPYLPEVMVPASHRINSLGFVLTGNPTEKITMFGGRYGNNGQESTLAEYDMGLQRWIPSQIEHRK